MSKKIKHKFCDVDISYVKRWDYEPNQREPDGVDIFLYDYDSDYPKAIHLAVYLNREDIMAIMKKLKISSKEYKGWLKKHKLSVIF